MGTLIHLAGDVFVWPIGHVTSFFRKNLILSPLSSSSIKFEIANFTHFHSFSLSCPNTILTRRPSPGSCWPFGWPDSMLMLESLQPLCQ